MRWLVLLVVACKGGDKPAPAVASGSAGSAGSAVVAASDAAVGLDASLANVGATLGGDPLTDIHAPATRCAVGCLYLVDTPLATAREQFARECHAPWPYPDDDCDLLLYARNCIYAAHGNVFKRPEWKQKFETATWYKPNPKFKEKDFSPTAEANVKALVKLSKTCPAGGGMIPAVSQADIDLMIKTFDKLRLGDSMPGVSESFADTWANYAIDDKSMVTYVEQPTKDRRAIMVEGMYHAVGPGKFDPTASVVIVFDGNDKVIEAN